MQSVAYTHNKPRVAAPVKSQNQFKPQRRDGIHHRVILAAVREWESTLPGQAQERIAQLVAEEWAKVDSHGITVNKQNLFRYLKNEGGSEKYTAYIMQLSGSIIAAMPVQIARKHGLSNASTEAELVANAIKECSEAH
ncbi:toxin YdaT family protein, partial [Citrobacter freundii]